MLRPKKTNRDPYFDNIKAILVFLVVLSHFTSYAEFSYYAMHVRLFTFIFLMPAFIFISGLFFKRNEPQKAYVRAIAFFIMYIFAKAITWALRTILYHSTDFSLFNTGGVEWFLLAMAVWSIITPITRFVDSKLLLLTTLGLALIVGYDQSINSYFVLSRIIVYWPIFIMGTIIDRNWFAAIINRTWIKTISILVLVASFLVILLYYDDVVIIKPLLSGQHPYTLLEQYKNYGCIMRLIVMAISSVLGFCIIALIPRQKHFFTYIGERSLAVYFYDIPVCVLTVFAFSGAHLWQYFVASVVITILFSTKTMYLPFKYLFEKVNINKGKSEATE
ncbi:MAG: acyltransferase family protein [Bacillota bacterium]|nr:acyltransferase family protein [Bacillota bacterium]